VLLSIFGNLATAQQDKIDSLEQVLRKTKDDSLRCELLFRIGFFQEGIDHKVSRKIYDSIVVIAQKNKYKLMEADAYVSIGRLGLYHGDYPLAIKYYNKAAVL
jgi:hypothetical protein